MSSVRLALLLTFVVGCGTNGRSGGTGSGSGVGSTFPDLGSGPVDFAIAGDFASAQQGCAGGAACYTIYAHANHVLYRVDLATKTLVTVGPFNAPLNGTTEDVLTDLAVAPNDTIYVVSKKNLYTADPTDGHVTLLGPLGACGTQTVALTTTPNGDLFAADFKGAFCKIDPATTPPTVTLVGHIGGGLAISGDIVAVADGTLYGTAYRLADAAGVGTQANNLLIKIDPATGQATQTIGSTGSPRLYAVAFAGGEVFGFTHDGSGNVVTINPASGVGTHYNTFADATTGDPISFAGAGVNSMVSAIP